MIAQQITRLERWAGAAMLPTDDDERELARDQCPTMPEWLWQTRSELGEEDVWEDM